MPASSSPAVGAGASGNSTVTTHAQVDASTIAEAEVQTGSVNQVSPFGQSTTASQSLETPSSQPAPRNSRSVLDAESELSVSLNQPSIPMPSAHATATADYPSKLKRDRDGNLCRWKPTVGTSANHRIGPSRAAAPSASLSDVSLVRSERSMQRDATLISAQRAVASASDARAAERDRHLADLEGHRSGKNKNDVAKDGAEMTELHVKTLEDSKLLRQRVPTAKELRMGGEFSECVDCDGAMDSSSGSTPFLEGGEIAQNSTDQATYRARVGPPEVTERSAPGELTRLAQHNASALIQSQLAQADADREYAIMSQSRIMKAEHASLVEQHGNQAKLYEAVISLMEMPGRAAASSSGNTVSLASGSASESVDDNKDSALRPWRFKDQRVTNSRKTN